MEFKASDHIGSRNQVITTKTGHRSGTSPRPVKQFFLQVLPDSKKGWGNPTYFRLEGPQCLSKASTFSHAMSSRCYTGSEQKRLVRYYRPEGCLLPHSNCGTSQEVPSFSCQWSDIPIKSSSFRLSPGTQNFYQMCACCTRTFTEPRHALAEQGRTRSLILHIEALGLKINYKKTCLIPAQTVQFIGMRLDSCTMRATLTEVRSQAIAKTVEKFKIGRLLPYADFFHLAGMLVAATPVVRLVMLRLQPLQRWLNSQCLSAMIG